VTTLPLWYGRQRGTDLSALIAIDDDYDDEEGGGINEVTAGIVGLLAPAALVAVVLASGCLPLAVAVLLGAVGAAWLGLGLAATWLVTFSDEDQPPWAGAVVAVLVGLGRIIVFVAFVVSLLVLLFMLIAFFAAMMSSDNR
jgi:hypothetical protein